MRDQKVSGQRSQEGKRVERPRKREKFQSIPESGPAMAPASPPPTGPAFSWQDLPILPPLQRLADGLDDGADPTPVEDSAADVHKTAARGLAGRGGRLPFFARIQQAFGRHDVSGIEAHTGPATRAAGRALGAAGFASGHHVGFSESPSLFAAAHEAAHVVQQRSGAVPAGMVGAAGDVYEQHANRVATRVLQGRSAEGLLDPYAGRAASSGGASAPVQLMEYHWIQWQFTRASASAVSSKYLRRIKKLLNVLRKHEIRSGMAANDDDTIDFLDEIEILDKLEALIPLAKAAGGMPNRVSPNRAYDQLLLHVRERRREVGGMEDYAAARADRTDRDARNLDGTQQADAQNPDALDEADQPPQASDRQQDVQSLLSQINTSQTLSQSTIDLGHIYTHSQIDVSRYRPRSRLNLNLRRTATQIDLDPAQSDSQRVIDQTKTQPESQPTIQTPQPSLNAPPVLGPDVQGMEETQDSGLMIDTLPDVSEKKVPKQRPRLQKKKQTTKLVIDPNTIARLVATQPKNNAQSGPVPPPIPLSGTVPSLSGGRSMPSVPRLSRREISRSAHGLWSVERRQKNKKREAPLFNDPGTEENMIAQAGTKLRELFQLLRQKPDETEKMSSLVSSISKPFRVFSIMDNGSSGDIAVGQRVEAALGGDILAFMLDADVSIATKIKLWKLSEAHGHILHNSVVSHLEAKAAAHRKTSQDQNDETLRTQEQAFKRVLDTMYRTNLRNLDQTRLRPSQGDVQQTDRETLEDYIRDNTMLARILVRGETSAHESGMAEFHPNFWGLFVTPPQTLASVNRSRQGTGAFETSAPSTPGGHIYNTPGHTRALFMRALGQQAAQGPLATFVTKGGGLDLTRHDQEYYSGFRSYALSQRQNKLSDDATQPIALFGQKQGDDAHANAGYGDWSMVQSDFKNFAQKYQTAQELSERALFFTALKETLAQPMAVATLANTLTNRSKLDPAVLRKADVSPSQMPTQITTTAAAETSRRIHRSAPQEDMYRILGIYKTERAVTRLPSLPTETVRVKQGTGPNAREVDRTRPKTSFKRGEFVCDLVSFDSAQDAQNLNSQGQIQKLYASDDWQNFHLAPTLEQQEPGALLPKGTELFHYNNLSAEIAEYKLATRPMLRHLQVPEGYKTSIEEHVRTDPDEDTDGNQRLTQVQDHWERVQTGYALMYAVMGSLAVFIEEGDSTGKIGDSFDARNISTSVRDADEWGKGQLRRAAKEGKTVGVGTLVPKDISDVRVSLEQALSSAGVDPLVCPEIFADMRALQALIGTFLEELFGAQSITKELNMGNAANQNDAVGFQASYIQEQLKKARTPEPDSDKGQDSQPSHMGSQVPNDRGAAFWKAIAGGGANARAMTELEALMLTSDEHQLSALFDLQDPDRSMPSDEANIVRRDNAYLRALWEDAKNEFRNLIVSGFQRYVASEGLLPERLRPFNRLFAPLHADADVAQPTEAELSRVVKADQKRERTQQRQKQEAEEKRKNQADNQKAERQQKARIDITKLVPMAPPSGSGGGLPPVAPIPPKKDELPQGSAVPTVAPIPMTLDSLRSVSSATSVRQQGGSAAQTADHQKQESSPPHRPFLFIPVDQPLAKVFWIHNVTQAQDWDMDPYDIAYWGQTEGRIEAELDVPSTAAEAILKESWRLIDDGHTPSESWMQRRSAAYQAVRQRM